MLSIMKPYLCPEEFKAREIAIKIAKSIPITVYEQSYITLYYPQLHKLALDASGIEKKLQHGLILCDSRHKAESILKQFVDVILADSRENPLRSELYLEAVHSAAVTLYHNKISL